MTKARKRRRFETRPEVRSSTNNDDENRWFECRRSIVPFDGQRSSRAAKAGGLAGVCRGERLDSTHFAVISKRLC
jgi:hypothetical protein